MITGNKSKKTEKQHALHDLRITFYVLQVKNKLSLEPTYIHTQTACYR